MIVERIDPLSKWIELKAELDRFRKTVVKDALSRRRTVPFEKRHSEFLKSGALKHSRGAERSRIPLVCPQKAAPPIFVLPMG